MVLGCSYLYSCYLFVFFIFSDLYLVHILTVFFLFFFFFFFFSFSFSFSFFFFFFLSFFFFSQEKPNKFQSTEMKNCRAQKPTNQYKETKDLVLLDTITKVYPFSFLFSFTYLRTIFFVFFCFFIIFFKIFNFLCIQMVDLEEK